MTALVIARNTFREATRGRVLVGLIAAGLVALGATQALSPLALGEGTRITTDFGLSAITFLGLVVVLMEGASMVAKEIERRTIYNLLSRPIPRGTYLVGKWVGLSAALWLLTAVLGTALWVVLALRGAAGLGGGVAAAVFLAGLELSVVTALAVLFSALSTPVLSALYTLGFYVAGQWTYDIRGFATRFPPGIGRALEAAATLLPTLPLFNARTLAADGLAPSAAYLAIAAGYAALYVACVLCLATAAFETKDFK